MDNTKQEVIFSLKDILKLVPGNIYWKDRAGKYLGCSANLAHLMGFKSIDEVIGKNDYDILPHELASNISQADQAIMDSGIERTFEEHGVDSKGLEAIYLTKKTPLFDETGKVIGLIGSSIDITANKKAHLELLERHKQNELTLEDIIAFMPVNVYWMDKHGILLGCSDNQLSALGLKSRAEFVGKIYTDVLRHNNVGAVKKVNEQVLNTGQGLTLEEAGLDDKGGEAIYLTKKIPLFDKGKHVIGLLGISFDITDRKKAEEYRLKHEAAQKVIKFSNLVAGSIAHELKNPLSGIRIQMESLQAMDVDKISQQTIGSLLKDIASSIIRTIDTTTYVIDGMLKKVRTFATGEVHHKELEEISIVDDIENLLNTYPFNDNQQDLITVIYGARFNYLGDKVLTAHVLSNLMKNALHAIGETDKDDATITIKTKAGADFNLLIFRDTATGISKDFVDKIFDQFETKKDVHGGTGLGLAFCKSVMEDSCKGSIVCNSEKGKYTEFVLSFPKLKSKQGSVK